MNWRILATACLLAFSCTQESREEKHAIITQPEKSRSEKLSSSANEVETDRLKTSFKSINLLSGKLRLDVPSTFEVMNPKMFNLKYPLENPNITDAYSNKDGTVTLLVSYRKNPATQNDLNNYLEMLNNSLGGKPSIELIKSRIKQINGRSFILFEMMTPAADTRVYNKMFGTSLDGRLLMCTFNCTEDRMNKWKPTAQEIINSVRIHQE